MKSFFIFLIFLIKCCSASTFNNSYLIFVGSNFNDFRNLSINSSFSRLIGTKYFDLNKLTVLIVHGWRENYQDEMTSTLVDAFLTRPEYNIVFADWSRYADIDDYITATGAIGGVAKVYVQLLNQLESTGYDLTKIYAVGHSLGAHLAGKVGEIILKSQNILLSRITGLDPAGPLFTLPITINILGIKVTLPGNNLLVKGNAKFVDIIHTNAGVAGTMIPSGDLDFWPNGGKTQSHCIGCGPVDCKFKGNVINVFCSGYATGGTFNTNDQKRNKEVQNFGLSPSDKCPCFAITDDCKLNSNIPLLFPSLVLNAISCNECEHSAAWLYYAESVRSLAPNFKAIRCPKSVIIYANNTCTGPATAFMGFHASNNSQPGNYFLTTRATAPYSN